MPLQRPRAEILREGPPPDDQLLVVRGGRNSLSDANLERASGDCKVRRRPEIRLARCGEFRRAGFVVAATFSNPLHFSVVLPDATPSTFAGLRSCFSEPVANPGIRARQVSPIMDHVARRESTVELWVDDHQEYEPGVVHGHLRHARVPMDPHQGDFLVVGDDDSPPVLAEVLDRSATGELRLRLLSGRPDSHPEFQTRRLPTVV